MRRLILALALVGFGAGSAVACPYMDVAETPKPIVTADGKIITPTAPIQTPMPDKTDG